MIKIEDGYGVLTISNSQTDQYFEYGYAYSYPWLEFYITDRFIKTIGLQSTIIRFYSL